MGPGSKIYSILARGYKTRRTWIIFLIFVGFIAIWNFRQVASKPETKKSFDISILEKNEVTISYTRDLPHVRTFTQHSLSRSATPGLLKQQADSIDECHLEWRHEKINSSHYEATELTAIKLIPRTNDFPEPINKNPFIKLSRDRFLYSALRWGPNNQIVGFHEMVMIAIAINRTVVLPRFSKHGFDKQNRFGKYIAPNHRMDIGELCSFVSCITWDAFQKTCGYQIDVILNTIYLNAVDITKIEASIGMSVLQEKENINDAFARKLIPQNRTSEKHPKKSLKLNEAVKLFNSDARCALYAYPYFDLRIQNGKGKKDTKIEEVTDTFDRDEIPKIDREIFAALMQHYKRPPYIKKMASDFLKNVTEGDTFLSVHWRYDRLDFLSETNCNRQNSRNNICLLAKNFTHESLADRITEKIESLENKTKPKHIYIASPPNQKDMIENVTKVLREKGYKSHTLFDLIQFIKYKYEKCEIFSVHFDEIISTTEMEICSRGVVFLRSEETTWSDNVMKTRVFGKIPGIRQEFDEYIFKTT